MFSSVSSVTQLWPSLCNPMDWSKPGFPVHHLTTLTLLKLMSIELVISSNHFILCRPFVLLPSIFHSIKVFSYEAVRIMCLKYGSFSFSISPSNEYSELVSFRIYWLDLLAVQGTLKKSSPTTQFKSINSSALTFLYSPTLISIHDYRKNP